MFAHPTRVLRGFAPAAVVLALVGVGIVPLAFARIATNTIDPGAIVTDNGRHLM